MASSCLYYVEFCFIMLSHCTVFWSILENHLYQHLIFCLVCRGRWSLIGKSSEHSPCNMRSRSWSLTWDSYCIGAMSLMIISYLSYQLGKEQFLKPPPRNGRGCKVSVTCFRSLHISAVSLAVWASHRQCTVNVLILWPCLCLEVLVKQKCLNSL